MRKLILLTILTFFAFNLLAQQFGLRINLSNSYPLGIYRVTGHTFARGDLVEVCLPFNLSTLAIERHYIPSIGACRTHPPLIKCVVGIPGDIVQVTETVTINGAPVPNSTVFATDQGGKPLTPYRGTLVLGDRQYWLMSEFNERSYDSRYIGPLTDSDVLHKVVPLWTL